MKVPGTTPARYAPTRFPGKPLAVIAARPLEMSTTVTAIRQASEHENPNLVKVVVNMAGCALHFSPRTIPYLHEATSRWDNRQFAAFPFLKRLDVYCCRRKALLRPVRVPVAPLESAEKREQLHALGNGIHLAMVNVDYDFVDVELPENAGRGERLLQRPNG